MWKLVPQDDLYEISNLGHLRRWNPEKAGYDRIKWDVDAEGYCFHIIKGCRAYAQWLVADAFMEKPRWANYLKHRGKDKSRNMVSNLRWVALPRVKPHYPDEVWRPIYDGLYMASSRGRIKRMFEADWLPKGIIDQFLQPSGYWWVSITLPDHAPKQRPVHQLVCEAFHGPKPPDCECVNHLNGIKTDNRPENLEWTTLAENTRHAVRTGLKKSPQGERVGTSKLKKDQVLMILARCGKGSTRTVAKEFGVGPTTIRDIWNHKNWKHLIL